MKYVIMFTSTPAHDAAVSPEVAQDVYARVYQWFQDNADSIEDSGAELQPVDAATTVRHGATGAVVVDGPFTEAREAVGQRIVRAKRRIGAAGIPLRVPEGGERAPRLDMVLTVISVMYNMAHLLPGSDSGADRDVAEDALWLAEVVAHALPGEPEAWGLVALLRFHRSREPARALEGEMVLLADQDRMRWDAALQRDAHRALSRAAGMRRSGRWQLHAAIAACHSDAQRFADTDWAQIVALYDLLLVHDASPVVRLNRAVAVGQTGDVKHALAEVEALHDDLVRFHLWHAVRGDLLRRAGREDEAVSALRDAHELAVNDAERRLLRSRVSLEP